MRTGGLVVAAVSAAGICVVALGCGTRTGLLTVDGAFVDEDVGGGGGGGGDAGGTPDSSLPVCGSEPNACASDAGGADAFARLQNLLVRCKPGVRCEWATVVFDDAGCLSDASFWGLSEEEQRCVVAGTVGARHPCLARQAMVAQGPSCP